MLNWDHINPQLALDNRFAQLHHIPLWAGTQGMLELET
jgi:hypothetical protein